MTHQTHSTPREKNGAAAIAAEAERIRSRMQEATEREAGFTREELIAGQDKVHSFDQQAVKNFIGLEYGFNEFTDEELVRLVVTSSLDTAKDEIIFEGLVRALQLHLAKDRSSLLDDDLQTYCEEAKARLLTAHGGHVMPPGPDDRFAENMELMLGIMLRTRPAGVSAKKHLVQCVKDLQAAAREGYSDILIRMPHDDFKSLVYFGRITRPEDFAEFLAAHEHVPQQNAVPYEASDPIDVFASLQLSYCQAILKRASFTNTRQFSNFVFNPKLYPLARSASPTFIVYLTETMRFTDPKEFVEAVLSMGALISDTFGSRAEGQLEREQTQRKFLTNATLLAKHFRIDDYTSLKSLMEHVKPSSA
ncbi:MAG: hypothetical protein KDD42_07425, partial [Bdellovibrionales bacterium]|nr:hypothetical protein [Bdellovibrionales bacterium]